jgi:hypothetical protein
MPFTWILAYKRYNYSFYIHASLRKPSISCSCYLFHDVCRPSWEAKARRFRNAQQGIAEGGVDENARVKNSLGTSNHDVGSNTWP